MFVIGDDDGGERKSYYHPDYTKQGAPDRKRKENYRRIQTKSLSHDLRCQEIVTDALAYHINQCAFAKFRPEFTDTRDNSVLYKFHDRYL